MFQLKISVANNHWWTQGIDSWSPTSLLDVTVVVDFIENYKSYSLDLKQLRWKRNNQTCQKENEMHKNLLNIKHKTIETQEGLKNTKQLFSNLHCGFYIRAEVRSFNYCSNHHWGSPHPLRFLRLVSSHPTKPFANEELHLVNILFQIYTKIRAVLVSN